MSLSPPATEPVERPRANADRWTLQSAAQLAEIVGILVALLVAGAAFWQLKASADSAKAQELLAREIATNQSWEGYMELAFQHPEFSEGANYEKLNPKQKLEYSWFVERMLFAGEQILKYARNDGQWVSTIEVESQNHLSYIEKSPRFLKDYFCDYSSEMRILISEISESAAVRNKTCGNREKSVRLPNA